MRIRFNQELLMWAIGVLQPASIKDALGLIEEVLPDVSPLPLVKELEPIVSRWREGARKVQAVFVDSCW
jgi:hypothetical protein